MDTFDFLGNELKLGDYVIYRSSHKHLTIGKISYIADGIVTIRVYRLYNPIGKLDTKFKHYKYTGKGVSYPKTHNIVKLSPQMIEDSKLSFIDYCNNT